MSNPGPYRPPAWGGLIPPPRVYVPADPDLARVVAAALGRKGALLRLQNAGDAGSVFLRMNGDDGNSWFIKVVSVDRTTELQAAEALARWLQAAGVRVIAAESAVDLGGGRSLWSYPYHAGRPPDASAEDMAVIGAELGRLHLALRRHPSLAEWRGRTEARLARLSAVREALAEGALAAGPEPALLRQIARDRSIDFLPGRYVAADGCIALHGDLNRFNLLIDGQGCTFLDFEDVCHSVLPPIFDLATVAERIALLGQSPASALQLMSVLFDAYAAATGSRPSLAQVPDVRRGLALRSLCTLAEIDPSGSDDQEWRKFFHLLSDAEARRETASGTDIDS